MSSHSVLKDSLLSLNRVKGNLRLFPKSKLRKSTEIISNLCCESYSDEREEWMQQQNLCDDLMFSNSCHRITHLTKVWLSFQASSHTHTQTFVVTSLVIVVMETDDESEQEAGCLLSRAVRWEWRCNMSTLWFMDGTRKGHSLPLTFSLANQTCQIYPYSLPYFWRS